jgi:hypothetical protein
METKFKIIETEDYILAVYNEGITIKLRYLYNKIREDIKETYNDFDEKIIAYQPKGNAPELDLLLLPEMVVEDDIEKLAEQDRLDTGWEDSANLPYISGFVRGHNAATKTYSEEDLRKAFIQGKHGGVTQVYMEFDEFIQSLKQPKPKWFVAEMEEECGFNSNGYYSKIVLKTTKINGKTYLVGKYVNE